MNQMWWGLKIRESFGAAAERLGITRANDGGRKLLIGKYITPALFFLSKVLPINDGDPVNIPFADTLQEDAAVRS